jgi:hypothetical protein
VKQIVLHIQHFESRSCALFIVSCSVLFCPVKKCESIALCTLTLPERKTEISVGSMGIAMKLQYTGVAHKFIVKKK